MSCHRSNGSAETRYPGEDPGRLVGLRTDGDWQQLQTQSGAYLGVEDVVSETGAPAMCIYVVESEWASVDAVTPGGDGWWGYLNPQAAVNAYEAQEPPESVEDTAARAVSWARATGHEASSEAVASAMTKRPGPFGEGIDEFTEALGFRFGEFHPLDAAH